MPSPRWWDPQPTSFVNPRVNAYARTRAVTTGRLGALGDSFYEYLIKQWLITNKKEPQFREMFDDAMISIARCAATRAPRVQPFR